MNKRLSLFFELMIIPPVILALFAWGSRLGWRVESVSSLTVFPLLGLLAFSIMWWHFLLGFVGNLDANFKRIKSLHRTSTYFVLLLILLHPILLLVYSASYRLGGFPEAFYNYVQPSDAIYITYGILALVIFLLYDLARWLKTKSWVKSNWFFIDLADDIAFIAIFVHSLSIGQHLRSGWFRYVWIFYGASAVFFISYKHYLRFSRHEKLETK